MKNTLEGGSTLQRHLHRQMACWITIAGGLGLSVELEMSTPFFAVFSTSTFLHQCFVRLPGEFDDHRDCAQLCFIAQIEYAHPVTDGKKNHFRSHRNGSNTLPHPSQHPTSASPHLSSRNG